MRRSIRAFFIFGCALGIGAAAGPLQAQSLTDAVSQVSRPVASPLTAAAPSAWNTVVTPEPVLEGWVPVKARNWLMAAHLAGSPVAVIAPGEAPRGPRLTGAGHALHGLASYYGTGEMTATGERFDPMGMTAAHRTLPFGTRVRVTRVDTGSSVVVRINDRGPFKPGRVIDLSQGAAQNLGMMGKGLADVRLEVLGQ